jgi:MFS family permease
MHDKAATSIADTGKAASDPAAPAPVPVAVPVPAAPAPPATPDKPFEIGALAAISIAIGALGSAIAAVATGFLKLAWWQMPLVLVGLMLAVSGPSVILAWLKLHRRNIGPLLDANGWAVNAQAKLNIPFGESLTAVATLPPNAERSLDDPFAEPKPKWRRYVFAAVAALVLAAAWELGYLELGWEKLRAYHRAPPAAPAASASAAPAAAPPKK